MTIALIEGRLIVAAVPKDDIRVLFRLAEDLSVVYAGEDDRSAGQMRLILFSRLDRRIVLLEVLIALEPLDSLFREISVGHRMPHDGDLVAHTPQDFGRFSTGLALAATGSSRSNGDYRLLGPELGGCQSHQPKIGPGSQDC